MKTSSDILLEITASGKDKQTVGEAMHNMRKAIFLLKVKLNNKIEWEKKQKEIDKKYPEKIRKDIAVITKEISESLGRM